MINADGRKILRLCFGVLALLLCLLPCAAWGASAFNGFTNSSPQVDDELVAWDTSAGVVVNVTFQRVIGYSINIETKTDNYTITTYDFGKTLRMNATIAKTFSLPSVGEDEDGAIVIIEKIGSGNLTATAADSDTIADSTGGGSILNTTTETYATIVLEYVHTNTQWIPRFMYGTWSTE